MDISSFGYWNHQLELAEGSLDVLLDPRIEETRHRSAVRSLDQAAEAAYEEAGAVR